MIGADGHEIRVEPTRESVARMLREANLGSFAADLDAGADAWLVASRVQDAPIWFDGPPPALLTALRELARIEAEAPTTPPPSSRPDIHAAWTRALMSISDAAAAIEADARALRDAGHHTDAAAMSVLAATVRGAMAGALQGRELSQREEEGGMGSAVGDLLADWRRQ